jgi:hypothetical protein
MPKVSNTRNHVQVFGRVRLDKGDNEVTDDQLKALQQSETFKKAQARGWVGVQRDRSADKAPEVTPGKPQGARVQSETSPAQPDGAPVEPGTKPEVAPMDFPEANRSSASKAPSRK